MENARTKGRRWSFDGAKEEVRRLHRAGVSFKPRELAESGHERLYEWVERRVGAADSYPGGWSEFVCDALGLAFPAEASRFTDATYAPNGVYLRPPLNLTTRNYEIITGLLLGDGSIHFDNRNPARPTASLRLKNKHRSFAEWAKVLLPQLGGGITECEQEDTRKVKGRKITLFHTLYTYYSDCRPDLIPLYQHWYRADGTKRVPADVAITPLSVLLWYLGDGYKPRDRHGKDLAKIATDSFTLEEIEMLRDRLSAFGFRVSIDKVWGKQGQYNLRIPTSQAADFFKVMGPAPTEVPELAYRWPRNAGGRNKRA